MIDQPYEFKLVSKKACSIASHYYVRSIYPFSIVITEDLFVR